MLRRIVLLFFISITISSYAQQTELKDDQTRLDNGEDVNVLYKNESSFGIYAHTNTGIGLAYRRGKHVTGKRKRMFEVEVQNFKHPKEIKIVNTNYDNSKGFVYGKLNSFFVARTGIGYQNVMFPKVNKKNVEIRYSWFIGGNLNFAKPVYLEIIRQISSSTFEYAISTERFDPEIHYPDNIYGKASFFKGIEKMTVHPAGYAKFALSFEYADRYNSIKAVEVGSTLDVYPRVLPMMAFNKKQQVFASLYIKMIWGKKWF